MVYMKEQDSGSGAEKNMIEKAFEKQEKTQVSPPYLPIAIKAVTLAEAWERAVRKIMRSGYNRYVQAPEYQTWTKDCPMFISVKNPMKEPRISPKAPIQHELAEEYSKNLLFGMTEEKEKSFEYSYFTRLRHYPDCMVRAGFPFMADEKELKDYVDRVSGGKCIVQKIDQVQKAVEIFRKDPTRRTVVLHTWIPFRDLAKFTPERVDTSSPCLVLLHPQLVEDKLHMNVVMKTNDLFNAWPGNAYAFTELQKYIAEQIGVGVGHYNHFSVAMQIYQDVYEAANGV